MYKKSDVYGISTNKKQNTSMCFFSFFIFQFFVFNIFWKGHLQLIVRPARACVGDGRPISLSRSWRAIEELPRVVDVALNKQNPSKSKQKPNKSKQTPKKSKQNPKKSKQNQKKSKHNPKKSKQNPSKNVGKSIKIQAKPSAHLWKSWGTWGPGGPGRS